MDCGVLYIIEKLLERRCLKWACVAHLDIWNISYVQKKGHELNCQFDSQPEKIGNRPDLLSCRRHATYRWKDLDESYNFVSNRSRSEVCSQNYGVQGRGSPGWCDFGIPTRESWEKKAIWMWAMWRGLEYTIREKVVASPSSGRGESCVSMLPMAHPNIKGARTMH